jgi:hypothetical protein
MPPIQRLPAELLMRIFYIWRSDIMHIRGSVGCDHLGWFAASWVCRYWRETTFSHAAFWNHVPITKRDRRWGLLGALLRRSKDVPLYINIKSLQIESGVLLLISEHLYRVKELTVQYEDSEDTLVALAALASPAPRLAYLALQGSSYLIEEICQLIFSTFLSHSAPTLEEANISGLPITPLLPLINTVTRLSLTPYEETTIGVVDCLKSLEQLKELDINFGDDHFGHNPSVNPIQIPSLLRVVVRGNLDACAAFMETVFFPQIRFIRLELKMMITIYDDTNRFYSIFPLILQRYWSVFEDQGRPLLHLHLSAHPWYLEAYNQEENEEYALQLLLSKIMPLDYITASKIINKVFFPTPEQAFMLTSLDISSFNHDLGSLDDRVDDYLKNEWANLLAVCINIKRLRLRRVGPRLGSMLLSGSAGGNPSFPAVVELHQDLYTYQTCGHQTKIWLKRHFAAKTCPVKIVLTDFDDKPPNLYLIKLDNIEDYPFS